MAGDDHEVIATKQTMVVNDKAQATEKTNPPVKTLFECLRLNCRTADITRLPLFDDCTCALIDMAGGRKIPVAHFE
jgi:hypothetical protein